MNIPVKVEGAAPGVLNSGGVLVLNKRKLRVKALPTNLPDVILLTSLTLNWEINLYTAELQTEDFIIVHPDNTVVCQVRTSRASIIEEEEEEETAEATEAGAKMLQTEAPAES